MTYEIYRYIFIGGAALSGIMLVISAIMFFSLRIPTVIGDLSGANARKAIKRIRSYNESTGDKTHRSSPVNNERGKVTDKMTPSGRVSKEPERESIGTMGTAKLRTKGQISGNLAQNPEATTLLDDSYEATTVLNAEPQVMQETSSYEATTVLNAEPQVMQETDSYEATTVLNAEPQVMQETSSYEATTVLNAEPQVVQVTDSYEATTVLDSKPQVVQEGGSYSTAAPFEQMAVPDIADEFVIEYEITYRHTTERIV